jgi:glycine betaine/choline ABC-type transport system substrate-binding protein
MMKPTWKKTCTLFLLCCFTLLSLAGCGGTSNNQQTANSDPIRIGCKPIPEQMILQEILAQLIEDKTDLTVERLEATAGGTSNIQIAMENGEMDLYPEYTGTGWLTVLKNEASDDADYIFTELNKQYNEKYDMSWISLYGFENTYTLAVRPETASQYGLVNISDLSPVSDQLIFGANFDYFERDDGYNALCAAYNLNFKGTAEVDQGLKYQALAEGNCDVINAYTTDSQIADYGMVTLADDEKFFTDYRCSTVIRNEVLQAHPELKETLELMEGLISNEEMMQMNYELNTNHRLEKDIAAEFLQSKGLID